VTYKNYRLFDDYNCRTESANYVDGHDSLVGTVYQPFVYEAAFELVKKTQANYIIDIGCGDGRKIIKIKDYVEDCKIIMIDHAFIINNISVKYDFADYIAADLDVEIPNIEIEILKNAVIVCSDVIEHLRHPNVLLSFLSQIKTEVKAIVLSTPDRNQERGLFDYGPPANPFHVFEWSLDEFTRLLNDYGFTNRIFAGLTISNTLTKVKATSVVISSKYVDNPIEKSIKMNFANTPLYFQNYSHSLHKEFKKIFQSMINEINEDEWYLFKNEQEKISTANLRVEVNDLLSLADSYDFNIVEKTRVAIDNKTDNLWHGNSYLVENKKCRELAAVKGSFIKNVIEFGSQEARVYPFNLIGLEKSNERSFIIQKVNKNFHLSLNNWHECIVRKDFILELLFGASFYAK